MVTQHGTGARLLSTCLGAVSRWRVPSGASPVLGGHSSEQHCMYVDVDISRWIVRPPGEFALKAQRACDYCAM